ncbi:MAG: tetratricopeptide repeat protein [Acidobacteriaceae bacterium]
MSIGVWPQPARAQEGQAQKNFATQRAAYAAQISDTYKFPWGKEHPFWPSNAKIEGGTFIQPGAFPTAAYCAHCHEAAYRQWRESAHANAFREPFYLKNVQMLMDEKGTPATRHCEGCHNPIALFSGALTPGSKVKRAFDNDGVTCMVCHSITKLQANYGTGSYVMGVPAVMVDANGNPIPGEASFDAILAHPERHSKAVMKGFYKSSEYCGTCHKAALPSMVNGYKWLRAFGTYDEWQTSSYSHQNPLPFYSKKARTCAECHMAAETSALHDYSAKNGAIASHRWTAGNTAVPFYYNYPDQLHKTEAFLKDQRLNVDIFALRKASDSKLIAPLGSASFTMGPKDVVEAMVVIQNELIGHSLIPEQRDFYEAWVEFKVTDATGRVISHSGYLNPNGTLDKGAHSFTDRMIDKNGNYLDRHQIWSRRVVAYDNTIQSGRSTLVRYQFRVPENVQGPLQITARVNYRHFRQGYLNFVLGDMHPAYPVVDVAERTRTIQMGRNSPEAPISGDNPDWMRWNNLGIALLDQQQYAMSVHAFEQVAKMRPDYADAYTNIAVAELSWEKYGSARASVERALQLSSGNARALYYLALVERNQGHLDSAITDLRSVVQQFPQSRDAHRELGYSYYQEHQYAMARKQYELLQKIDPDDLAAHYNLAILYRRLGMKRRAAQEAALFADEKDDPMANTYALNYLREHPNVSNESALWHLHSDLHVHPNINSNAN